MRSIEILGIGRERTQLRRALQVPRLASPQSVRHDNQLQVLVPL